MKKIIVMNPKGGCGKTTIATNLASYYALWGVSSALVDYDSQQSSMDWLAARSDALPPIRGIAAGGTHAPSIRYPHGTVRVVMDVPARSSPEQHEALFRHADVVIIPVLPSAIDIRGAARFLGEALLSDALQETRVGIIANRVRENTIIYGQLQEFLGNLKIPFVTTLRDTQNYVRASIQGIGIFEMAPSLVYTDLDQWRPLIHWIEGKKKR